jgi:ABC-2 type transport system permease protein
MTAHHAVWLIMRREIRARLFSRTFAISLAVIVAVIVAVSGLGRLLGGDDTIRIGLVGDQPAGAVAGLESLARSAGIEIEVGPVADRAEGERLLLGGDLDGVVVDGRTLLMDRIADDVVTLVAPVWQQAGLVDGLEARGLGESEIGDTLEAARPVEVVEIDPDPESGARERVAFATVVLMFVAIQVTGGYIMMGIFEEKSTRVVELILASVPARHLLAGKVLGIAVLGLVQVAVLASTAIITSTASGAEIGSAVDPILLASSIVWFLLGYLLYGAVFAAGASLAPRQEDAQATLAPVTLILLVSYLGVISTAGDPTGTAARVVSWIPLTAPFAMPGRIAAEAAPWWEMLGSLAVTGAGAVVVLLVAERIYVRSILHTDRKLGWREAWSMEN